MKLDEIKSKIYSKMAMHSLKKIGEDISKTEKESVKAIEELKKSLSSDGKTAYEKLEKKAADFYDNLPLEYKQKYDELMVKLDLFKMEVKKLTEEETKAIETKYNSNISY